MFERLDCLTPSLWLEEGGKWRDTRENLKEIPKQEQGRAKVLGRRYWTLGSLRPYPCPEVWNLSFLLNVTHLHSLFSLECLPHFLAPVSTLPIIESSSSQLQPAWASAASAVPQFPSLPSPELSNLSSRRRESITLAELISTCTKEHHQLVYNLAAQEGGWGLASPWICGCLHDCHIQNLLHCTLTQRWLPPESLRILWILISCRVTPFIYGFVHLCIYSIIIYRLSGSFRPWSRSSRQSREQWRYSDTDYVSYAAYLKGMSKAGWNGVGGTGKVGILNRLVRIGFREVTFELSFGGKGMSQAAILGKSVTGRRTAYAKALRRQPCVWETAKRTVCLEGREGRKDVRDEIREQQVEGEERHRAFWS